MSYSLDDTIVALASAPGGAARGIVRLSGPQALNCLRSVAPALSGEGDGAPSWSRRQAIATRVWLSTWNREAPATAYVWPTSSSYTRQPTVELHALGSPPLLDAIVQACCLAGARLAEPGEFTLRAFLSGQIDLTQAEAVLGVIDAAAPGALRTALAQLAGGLARPLDTLRGDLLDLLARLEAGLDFVEEDIEFATKEEIAVELARAATAVEALRQQITARGEATVAPRVVLRGAPNAGKSALYNALLRQAAAIVAEVAGTTRDALEAELDLGALRCLLVDTAGADEVASEDGAAGDEIAQEAQRQAGEQHAQAELVLWCRAAGDAAEFTSALSEDADKRAERVLRVWTKCDLAPGVGWEGAIETSAVTGVGIEALRAEIAARLRDGADNDASVVAGTQARCRESIELAAASLARAARCHANRAGEELVVAELRVALQELGKVAGRVVTDDVLDRIFSRFCIGK